MCLRRALICCGAVVALPLARLQSQDTARKPPQKLETVTVKDSADFISTRLVGFERRRLLKPGSVTFFTGEEITKRGTIRLSDALRRAHGVTIVDSENGDKLVASSRMQLPSGGGFITRGVGKPQRSDAATGGTGGASSTGGLAPCVMPVAVDGHLKEKSFAIDEISVTDVHGIEVYPGAGSLPAEFGSMKPDGWCGLVMIWTRSR